jgi:CDP-diglyceride synthetase
LNFDAGIAGLLMVVTANSAPWLASRLLRGRFAAPLDCSVNWKDGNRLLGDHKTWRGFIAAALASGLASQLFGFGIIMGIGFGMLAMAGDALSSSVKRRLQLAPGTEVIGLDQVPESLLPLMVFSHLMHLNAVTVAAIILVFFALDATTASLRHQRKRP